MPLKKLCDRFLCYNLWANERLISWLRTLDQTVLYKNTPSSFGTIDRTLQHILAAQVYWHAIIFEGQINEFNPSTRENQVEKVIDDLISNSKQLIEGLALLTEQQLTERIQASDSNQSQYEYILHLVNHSSYHRGQIITLTRSLGITSEIPVTDYDAYLWWIENMT